MMIQVGFLCITFLIGGLIQVNAQQLQCSPVQSQHVCSTLTGRNSLFGYPPQMLPGNVSALSPGEVDTGFAFLRVPPPDPNCETGFMHMFCLAGVPPCNNDTGLLLPICKYSCSAFTRLVQQGNCDSIIESAEGFLLAPSSTLSRFEPLFRAVLEFNCRNVSTYYFMDNPESHLDRENCTDLLTPEQTVEVLSQPNKCTPTPPLGNCSSTIVSQYTHYIPLRSRNITLYQQLLVDIVASNNFSENCTDIIVSLGCYITYPPCDSETGDAIPLCIDNCDTEFASIQSCVAEVTVSNDLSNMMILFNCFNVISYLPEFVKTNCSLCISSFELLQLTLSEIAGIIVGVGVFLILLVVLLVTALIVLSRRRVKKRRKISTRMKKIYSTEPDSPYYNSETKMVFIGHNDDVVKLSIADRRSYEKVFSSILVPYTTLAVGEEIGKGAFGKVFKGEIKKPDSKFEDIAIKTIKNLSSKDELNAFFAESLLMKDFSHPNILGLAGVCFDTADGVPYILLPFMANGSLKDFLKSKRINVTNVDTLPEDLMESDLVRMCLDVARGMEYLAEKKFVHRDLAARNCLLNSDMVVKVGDFGLARDLYSNDYYRAHQGARIPVKWMAPETLTDAISNEKTDVWSFGVTCWEVFSLGRGPYSGIQNQDIIRHITTDDKRLEKPSLCSEPLYSILMSQCWRLLPEERPTFSQLVVQLHDYWEEECAYVIDDLAPTPMHLTIDLGN